MKKLLTLILLALFTAAYAAAPSVTSGGYTFPIQTGLQTINDSNGNPQVVTAANPLPVQSVTPAAAASKATFVRGYAAPTATGTPVHFAASGTYVSSVVITAVRTGRVANTATVWIDAISTNDAQAITLVPGASFSITAPPGKVIDLGDLYVDSGTLTDGIFYLGVL